MKSKIIALTVLVILLVIFSLSKLANLGRENKESVVKENQIATTTDSVKKDSGVPAITKGVHMGEVFTENNVSVKPIELISDSRCGSGLTCIWAGTVSVKVEITEGASKRTDVIDLENPIKLKNSTLLLSKVNPYPEKDGKIPLSSYTFEFSVLRDVPSSSNPKGQCFVGGCSSQICSDQKDIVSTCEWRESYACYANAKCERQANGQCGWTETEELKMCLTEAR